MTYCVDFRYETEKTLDDYLEEYRPDVVLCVALILCGAWLVRGPQKAGKKQAEAQEDAAGDADFQEYHAMPDAPEMTLSDDTSAKEENGHDE